MHKQPQVTIAPCTQATREQRSVCNYEQQQQQQQQQSNEAETITHNQHKQQVQQHHSDTLSWCVKCRKLRLVDHSASDAGSSVCSTASLARRIQSNLCNRLKLISRRFAHLFAWRRRSRNSSSSSSEQQPPTSAIDNLKRLNIRYKWSLSSQSDADSTKQAPAERDVDCGYAWIILAVMFVINASTFGTARAYSLIYDKVARQAEGSRANAALPFTIMGAVENMGGPLTGYLLTRTRSWRLTVFVGSCLITLSHIMAAFCYTLTGQVLTMGLMCGMGLSFVTISSFQINNAYFVRYRSRAFGLGLTGAAFGTLYISPLCQFVLENYSVSASYLVLGLILFPNVLLSLLLKPKETISDDQNDDEAIAYAANLDAPPGLQKAAATTQHWCTCDSIATVSAKLARQQAHKRNTPPLRQSLVRVLSSPLFHLIWPTQLLFCWFNFVYGMIIVDFGKDRHMSAEHVAHLIPIWAFGQLVGRLGLGSLVDLRLISYKLFTVICFAIIAFATWALNNSDQLVVFWPLNDCIDVSDRCSDDTQLADHQATLIAALVFVLSAIISVLYILFNGLVVKYMDQSLTALSIGISSFTGSFFLLPRANVIGYYRDSSGNYDAMLTMFAWVSAIAAIVWLLLPPIFSRLERRASSAKARGGYKQNNLSAYKVDVISTGAKYSISKPEAVG